MEGQAILAVLLQKGGREHGISGSGAGWEVEEWVILGYGIQADKFREGF